MQTNGQHWLQPTGHLSRRIDIVDRIAHTVGVRIQPTLTKRTQVVRAVEAHQDRIENTMAIAQVVPALRWVPEFAIEPHTGSDRLLRALRTVGGISQPIEPAMTRLGQDRLP